MAEWGKKKEADQIPKRATPDPEARHKHHPWFDPEMTTDQNAELATQRRAAQVASGNGHYDAAGFWQDAPPTGDRHE